MNLSAAYGAAFAAAPLGMTADVVPSTTAATVASQESVIDDEVPVARRNKPMQRRRSREMYAIHVEIGREDAHMLCLFIAVFILSLLFSARR